MTSILVVSSETIYITPIPGTVTSTVTSTTSSIGVLSPSSQSVSSNQPTLTSSSSSDLSGSFSSSAGVAYVGVTLTPSFFSTTVTTTTTTTSSSAFSAALSSTSTKVSASFSSVEGAASVGVTLTPSLSPTAGQPAAASSSSVPTDSVSRSSAVFTCPDDGGTYYTDQDGNGYHIQCSTDPGSRKRALMEHGLHGHGLNREPISRIRITSDTQVDFAACVNSCRTIASCVGTSYVASSGICTYFSTLTSVDADTEADVAVPANISCPSLNGYSYLDSSGSEYGILCDQAYPASKNIASQDGLPNLAACSNACSFSAKCLASSFVDGRCTFISSLETNKNPGRKLPGAVMLVLLQSRAVEVISKTGFISRSTSISVVRDLPSAVAAVRKGHNPPALAPSDLLGCGDFWQPNCAIVAAATPSTMSSFSTVYTPGIGGSDVVGPVATLNAVREATRSRFSGVTSTPGSTSSSTEAPSVNCSSKLLGFIPIC
ncbi:hypothetical protein QM012_002564 [Aureobasidium pullulans]|uniref:Apple domain-containing protein n=1 Tax=Aureobasidium pullulans TaxID=5580 RepID=A0ABR0T9X5_AURPU